MQVKYQDSMDQYLNDIRDIELLSKEEEYELMKEVKDGNEDAMDMFILHNLRLVIAIAKKYVNKGIPINDLIQIHNRFFYYTFYHCCQYVSCILVCFF